MEQLEIPLEVARRHVAEAEARCAHQTKFLEKMEAQGSPQEATQAAGRMLDTLDRVLAILRQHLQQEEELYRQRGQDGADA
jgi:hypothetical protein